MTNICKIILLFAVIGVLSLSTAACGRYSAPYPVEDSGFPHTYPQHQ
ncbi:MAG: hypothetical protein IJ532_04370 [Alphaproteobacteria bacterium]|nr:hypothetical protein [Alphaproteobacteria bacterium]